MAVKILTAPQVVVTFQTKEVKDDKVVKSYKTMSLADFKVLEDKPKQKSFKVLNVPVESVEKGEIEGLNVTGYVARVRIVRPKEGQTWSPFVDCTLEKESSELDIQGLLDELF